MSSRTALVMIVCTVLGIAVVAWLGMEYRDEVRAFLRALLRAL